MDSKKTPIMVTPKNNPCFNCLSRHIGCHSKCEKYKKFKETVEVFREMQKRSKRYRSDRATQIYSEGYGSSRKNSIKALGKVKK